MTSFSIFLSRLSSESLEVPSIPFVTEPAPPEE